LTQLGSISLIYILTQNVKPSLLTYGIVFASFPVILLFLFNIFAFKTRYKNLKPTIKKWKLKYLKDIFGLGLNFFIIQISAIVLFATDNFIITHLFGPREVLPYNISFKYFSTLTMIYSILTTPYWSSFTDAYTKKDFVWIKKTVKTVNIIWLFFLFIIVLMLLCSNFVYKLWIGEKAQITFELSMSMALFSAIITYSSIYVNFLNGVGKIRIQVITSIVSMIINIPLSVFFVKTMGLGLSGIILATCLSLGYSVILLPIQYHKIINGTDKGIWAR
jgi:O-antigen/teichoic acid export membrane protein